MKHFSIASLFQILQVFRICTRHFRTLLGQRFRYSESHLPREATETIRFAHFRNVTVRQISPGSSSVGTGRRKENARILTLAIAKATESMSDERIKKHRRLKIGHN